MGVYAMDKQTQWKFDTNALLSTGLLYLLTIIYGLFAFMLIIVLLMPLPLPRPSEAITTVQDFIADVLAPIGWKQALFALAIVLLTVRPVYRWLRSGIHDLFYAQHDNPFALVEKMQTPLHLANDPQAVLAMIATTTAQTLKVPFVEISTQHDDAELSAIYGLLPANTQTETVSLRYQDTPLGELRVAARQAHESLSASDITILQSFARQIALALYAIQTTRQIYQSRQRLVTAREEERRRIRRDLHDGLGASLSSFVLRLEQAIDQLPANASTSEAMLTSLINDAQQAILDIRRLVYELRPPDLDEYGLLFALREYLHRMTTNGTTLTLHAPETLPNLPAAIEVAVYRITQEAVNNALKHAHASNVTVNIQVTTHTPRWLQLEICDDGVGITSTSQTGIGLNSMRERAQEVGGRWMLKVQPAGGVRVLVDLPLEDNYE